MEISEKKKYLIEHLSELITLKEQGWIYKDIAKKYDASTSMVSRLLRENGVHIRTEKTDEDIKDMIYLYEHGVSMRKIGKMYHLSECTVADIFKNNNVHINTISECKQMYTLNEKYFDVIDTHNKAYLLGWLWSDGHNSEQNHIIISLQESDKHILEFFNKELESNRPIKYLDRSKDTDFNRKNQYRLTITNKHMSDSLRKLGMNHDKGLTAKFPINLPQEFYSSFIKGYFEGDGFLSRNPKECRMNVTGTIWVCEAIQKILKDKLDVNSYLTIPHNKIDKPTRTLVIAGRNQVKKVLDFIYQDSEYKLQRKYDIYQEIYAA